MLSWHLSSCPHCIFQSPSLVVHLQRNLYPAAMYSTAPSPPTCLSSQLFSAYPSSFSRRFRLSQQPHHVGAQRIFITLHKFRSFAADRESSKEDSAEKGKIGTAVEGSAPTKLGFGSASKAGAGKPSKEKKKPATIRRTAPQQPLLQSPADPQAQQIETAYVASLAFLGFVIFVEGILLAASGHFLLLLIFANILLPFLP